MAHGLCISQLLKTQTPNISPMWRTGEGERERGGTTLKKNGLYFAALFTFFFLSRAEVHVLLKVVWDTGARRSGSCSLVNSLCNPAAAY